ncbi:hypothetical protein HF521_008804 [Silurus meridionalis]|uniref:SEFIR domain-containing protein n=1 Tax=Silurus meridionalis TaxID=175797 RepID=A0A8T0ANX9_SILME|nr:hypothetical protein HF521_008804 [Silurus meridionalis]
MVLPVPRAGWSFTVCHKAEEFQLAGRHHLLSIVNENRVVPPPDSGPIEVLAFVLEPALCCPTTQTCKPCLLTHITLKILVDDDDDVSGDTHKDSEDEESPAALTLCYLSAPNLSSCKRIRFLVKSDAWKNKEKQKITVVLYDGVFLGSSVNVSLNRTSQVVHIPQNKSVCPSSECQPLRIVPEIDESRGVVELKAEDKASLLICMKRKGMTSCLPSDWTIPLHSVTHCICPFDNHTGIRINAIRNVSTSVGLTETNEGPPALSWNLSAPCRLEVEVWPCQMAVTQGGGCSEVLGFRRNATKWEENKSTLWTSGDFQNFTTTDNLHLCVMFKVNGELLEPVSHRGRWSSMIFVVVLVSFLLTVGVFVFRKRIKEWLSNSNPTVQSGGRGEVLLVHSSGSDPSLSDTACWFATWLSELGFSVSLDLWNRATVNAMGPIPWLHSQLQRIQKCSGKILVLLSHDAMLRAEACYESWHVGMYREDSKLNRKPWHWNNDVFSSAINSLISARIQGGATEHFALVQMGSEELILPELFEGLKIFHLPSESQRLLADLHTSHLRGFGPRLKRFLWTWRASAGLKKRLRNYRKEGRSCTEPTQVIEAEMHLLEV